VAIRRAERTIHDLKKDLAKLEQKREDRKEDLNGLRSAYAKWDVYISLGFTFAGLASIPASGPVGIVVGVGSFAWGAKAFVEYQFKLRRLEKQVKDLDHRIMLKRHTIDQVKADLKKPPSN
jgi:hypothetical protein